MKHLYSLICLVLLHSFIQAQTRPVQFQSGSVLPPANLETFIGELQVAEPVGGYQFRYLQFEQIPNQAQKARLVELGIRLSAYIPHNTFMAAIPVTLDKTRLRGLGIVSVFQPAVEQKISRNLIGGAQAWAVNAPGTVDLDIQIQQALNLDAILPLVEAYGTLLGRHDANHTLTVRIPDNQVRVLASEPWVFYVNTIAAPSVKDDTKGRSLHRSNVINSDYASGRHYDGSGVAVAIADDGAVGPHIDFSGRMTQLATVTGGTHGDMTCGIAVGAGNLNPSIRGMASGADLVTFDISGYPQVVNALGNYTTYGVVVASTSYSQGCNEYTSDTQFGDQFLFENPYLQFVFSGGNNGAADCGYGAGSGWGNITGGYKQGKNVIACGNLDALEVLDPSSSRGPSADGRIKPDICANGRDQMSTNENNTYQVGGGTSAASPGIAGVFAQLYQAYKSLNGTTTAPAPLLKASLLNTAEDIGNPGPDFTYGWGRVNALRALRTLEESRYLSDSIAQGGQNTHSITVPAGTTALRAMLYWADPGGTPAAAVSLVNNLDFTVSDLSTSIWNPWVLDATPLAASLSAPAVRGVDSLNNMEQVVVSNPAPGTYTLTVNGSAIPFGQQRYYIVWEFRSQELTMTYPNGGEGFVPGQSEVLRWDSERDQGSVELAYTADDGLTWNTIATVAQNIQQYTWTVPNTVTGSARVRVSRNGFTDESDTSFALIARPSTITYDWACPDSIQISWQPAAGASAYVVYRLGQKFMEPVAVTGTTSAVIYGINPTVEDWFSVAAVTPQGNIGLRANAVRKAPGIFNCPLASDLSLVQPVTPAVGIIQSCQDNSAVPVSLRLSNAGTGPLSGMTINYSLNGAAVVSEPLAGTLAPGADTLFVFSLPVDLSVLGNYTMQCWITLPGDLNAFNDSVTYAIQVISGSLAQLPLIEDFETATNCPTISNCASTVCALPNNWINAVNGDADQIDFRVHSGATPSASTGPDTDHTTGTATGKYIYLEASTCFNNEAVLLSPCIDLTSSQTPQLLFWYHLYGSNTGELHVDVFGDGAWSNDAIPPFSGNQGNLWKQGVVNLAPWVGKRINVRFRGVTGGGATSDIALDDISILESSGPPVAAFTASSSSGCTGKTFTFTDQSLNAPTQWNWTFTPSTVSFVNGTSANSQNPQVVFNATGTYDVTLVASSPNGSGTASQTSLISILAPAAVPLTEDFQSVSYPPSGWTLLSAGGSITWASASGINGASGTTTSASFMDNFDYNNVGAEDGLHTFEVDLNAAVSSRMTFDVAHARYSAAYTDGLRIDVSTDCGLTWIPSGYLKTGTDLATVPDNTAEFYPSGTSDWRKDTVDLSVWNGQSILINFVNLNGYGNNLFVDNINIDAVTGFADGMSQANVYLYPNPTEGQFTLTWSGLKLGTSVQLTDATGRTIGIPWFATEAIGTRSFDLSQAEAGVYFIRLDSGAGQRVLRLILR